MVSLWVVWLKASKLAQWPFISGKLESILVNPVSPCITAKWCHLVQLSHMEWRNGVLPLNWVDVWWWFLWVMGGVGVACSNHCTHLDSPHRWQRAIWHELVQMVMTLHCGDPESISSMPRQSCLARSVIGHSTPAMMTAHSAKLPSIFPIPSVKNSVYP